MSDINEFGISWCMWSECGIVVCMCEKSECSISEC